MRYYDLTYPIGEGMPLFPGTPPSERSAACTLERDGFRETRLAFSSHTGTYMDAPAHLLPEGVTLDALPVSAFCGAGICVDCTAVEGGRIGPAALLGAGERWNRAEFVLLYTGWEARWGTPEYFADFPLLSEAAARLLAGTKGVGLDCPSLDPVDSAELPIHRVLLGAGTLLLENLRGLGPLCGKDFQLFALPLHYQQADGAPLRAVAVTGED